MSNFYCEWCHKVLNSKSDYGTIKGMPYCAECLNLLKQTIEVQLPLVEKIKARKEKEKDK